MLARGSARRVGALKVQPTVTGRGRLRGAWRVPAIVRTTFTLAGGRAVSVDRVVTLTR